MAIQQVGSPQNTSGTNVSSLTQSFTVQAGNNTVLIVSGSFVGSAFAGASVTGVTFGGVPLTFVGQSKSTSGPADTYTSLWYLLNPSV